MTARFAYRRAKVSAEVLASAKPSRSTATPAAPLSKEPLPAQEDAFKQVRVFLPGGAGRTTISIPQGEFEHMLSFANESHATVDNACLAASRVLEPPEGDSRAWAEVVAAGAMLALMEAYHSKRKAKPSRSTT